MMYLPYLSHTYATSNKLEAVVLELLQSHDRELVAPGDLVDFFSDVLMEIERLNAANTRCRLLKIKFIMSRKNAAGGLSDFLISWNEFPDSSGKKLCEFLVLASR